MTVSHEQSARRDFLKQLAVASAATLMAGEPRFATAETDSAEKLKHLRAIDQSLQREYLSDYHQQSMLRSLESAYRLLSSKDRDAFDITLEPKESFDKYNTGRFGQGCLLARRLVESGARFVEVTTE